jgi:hypothetical protein
MVLIGILSFLTASVVLGIAPGRQPFSAAGETAALAGDGEAAGMNRAES